MTRHIRAIAMVDTDGGDGIGGYTYELSEGLAAQGVAVDIYSNSRGVMHELPLPRHHRIFPVLGAPLFRQRHRLRAPLTTDGNSGRAGHDATPQTGNVLGPKRSGRVRTALRDVALALEFALYLKKQRYDLVWMQWPSDVYAGPFYSCCRRLGLPVVHTVHNILPHETDAGDMARNRDLYRKADVLIVHSHAAGTELRQLFPCTDAKIVLSRIGTYTMFRRDPAARHRIRQALHVAEQQPLVLFFGSVRPYKNVESVLSALCAPALHDAVLVVAGRETGYPDSAPADPLGHTRAQAARRGVGDRVRFLPGRLDLTATTELFEASDILTLPYTKSYGSAALLLGMTFGKHIVASRVGCMEEYLTRYPQHTLLDGSDAASVVSGLTDAVTCSHRAESNDVSLLSLTWSSIAREALAQLNDRRVAATAGLSLTQAFSRRLFR